MLQPLIKPDGRLAVRATVRRCGVYLDTFAILRLAKGDAVRRQRFLAALHAGADLVFSASNMAELAGPQGKSFADVRDFVNAVGPHWFPVELNPFVVTERETQGKTGWEACASQQLMADYRSVRMSEYMPGSGKVINFSSSFFQLGPLLDWAQPQRDSIMAGLQQLDATLIKRIDEHRSRSDHDPAWLDRSFPLLAFNPAMPATFTYRNLVRSLVVESKAYHLKKGDGLDFCHAVIGVAFARFASLDKQWKRRIASLPQPNQVAAVYYAPELDQLVEDLERAVA